MISLIERIVSWMMLITASIGVVILMVFGICMLVAPPHRIFLSLECIVGSVMTGILMVVVVKDTKQSLTDGEADTRKSDG